MAKKILEMNGSRISDDILIRILTKREFRGNGDCVVTAANERSITAFIAQQN